MATTIDHDTVAFVKESLKKHGFEHALQRCSVDCVAAGMDADDFTYQVVALFLTHILVGGMASYSSLDDKFTALQHNSKAMHDVLKNVTLQLAKQLDQQREVEAAILEKVDVTSVN